MVFFPPPKSGQWHQWCSYKQAIIKCKTNGSTYFRRLRKCSTPQDRRDWHLDHIRSDIIELDPTRFEYVRMMLLYLFQLRLHSTMGHHLQFDHFFTRDSLAKREYQMKYKWIQNWFSENLSKPNVLHTAGYFVLFCFRFNFCSTYTPADYPAPVRGQTFKRVVATDVLHGRFGAEPSVTETGQHLRMLT